MSRFVPERDRSADERNRTFSYRVNGKTDHVRIKWICKGSIQKLLYKAVVRTVGIMEEIMARYLVIVESPAKVKTIKKFLGSNYVVTASNGHVRDMPKSQMGIDIENDYEPKYITIRGKGEILAKLTRFIWQLTRTVKEKQYPGI